MSDATKGKWKANKGVITGIWYVENGNKTIAEMREDNAEANVRLIVALCSEQRGLKLAKLVVEYVLCGDYSPCPAIDSIEALASEILEVNKEIK